MIACVVFELSSVLPTTVLAAKHEPVCRIWKSLSQRVTLGEVLSWALEGSSLAAPLKEPRVGSIQSSIARRTSMLLARESRHRLFQQLHQDDDPVWYRASGRCICWLCSLPYSTHPPDDSGIDRRLCNGDVVHL